MPGALPFHLINAFAPSFHGGNQAAVVIFPANDERSTDEEWLKLVARDFNFSETAYLVPLDGYEGRGGKEGRWNLRWFTPQEEVTLCGHATLASAQTLFSLHPSLETISFENRFAGTLTARKVPEGKVEIVLPSLSSDVITGLGKEGRDTAQDEAIALALKVDAGDILDVSDFGFSGAASKFVLLKSEVPLEQLKVDIKALATMAGSWIVTQISDKSSTDASQLDINSRFFGPGLGVDEDPVTGSAHAYLTGYYLASPAQRFLPEHMRKDPLSVVIQGTQVSERRGELRCTWDGGKVKVVGKAFEFARGTLHN
ncbi:hypothetical protein IAU60_002750 [Kwoniella sp. DSM 27419]